MWSCFCCLFYILSSSISRLVSLYMNDCIRIRPALSKWLRAFPEFTEVAAEEPLEETIASLASAEFLASLFEKERLITFMERLYRLRTLVVRNMNSSGSLTMPNLSTNMDNPQQYSHLEMLWLFPTMLTAISKACPDFEQLTVDPSMNG